jgi:hypothetical protein
LSIGATGVKEAEDEAGVSDEGKPVASLRSKWAQSAVDAGGRSILETEVIVNVAVPGQVQSK